MSAAAWILHFQFSMTTPFHGFILLLCAYNSWGLQVKTENCSPNLGTLQTFENYKCTYKWDVVMRPLYSYQMTKPWVCCGNKVLDKCTDLYTYPNYREEEWVSRFHSWEWISILYHQLSHAILWATFVLDQRYIYSSNNESYSTDRRGLGAGVEISTFLQLQQQCLAIFSLQCPSPKGYHGAPRGFGSAEN